MYEAKKKILIVDDEVAFTEMVKFNLEATGKYRVIVENNSAAAIAVVRACQPDLILLDVIMPEPEGPDVLFQLRSFPDLQHIPVVFLTATVRKTETDVEPDESGYVFLAKPCTLKELIFCIESQLNR